MGQKILENARALDILGWRVQHWNWATLLPQKKPSKNEEKRRFQRSSPNHVTLRGTRWLSPQCLTTHADAPRSGRRKTAGHKTSGSWVGLQEPLATTLCPPDGARLWRGRPCLPHTQCDAVRPLDVFRHQRVDVHAVQAPFLDLGGGAPVRPVHKAGGRQGKQR